MITDARRRQLAAAGRAGASRRWITSPAIVNDMSAARSAFKASFERGHGCRACGPYVAIDQTLDDVSKARQVKALRSLHYERLRTLAVARRRSG